jgi:hypothetical protein
LQGAEAVSDQIGAAQDQDDARGKMSANDSGDEREGGNSAVDAAVDPISQVALLRPRRESLMNSLSGMLVFHAHLRQSN